MTVRLITPTIAEVPAYISALRTGFSPTSTVSTTAEELQRWQNDAEAELDKLTDPAGTKRGTVTLSDGSVVQRLPSIKRWIWDDDFCGIIHLRWPRPGSVLPKWAQGHVGYSVIAAKRRLKYATQAVAMIKPLAMEQRLQFIDFCLADEVTSPVVIANGGYFVRHDTDAFGNPEAWYRINLI